MLICVECGSSNGKGSLLGYYTCECDGSSAEIYASECPFCGVISGNWEAEKVEEVICRECMTRYF